MPVDQSTQGTPCEKGNAEEDGNCELCDSWLIKQQTMAEPSLDPKSVSTSF
jgi:hypothetical protein